MGQARTAEETEELRVRAAALRAAGVGSKRIAAELGIGGSLAVELLRGVPLPSSLVRPRAKDELREAAVLLRHLRRRGVGPDRLSLALSIHESADVPAATAYWSDVTGIPTDRFGRAMIKRHNPKTVRKNVGENYQGCLVVRVLQGRLLYQEIAGLWNGIVAGAGTRHDIL